MRQLITLLVLLLVTTATVAEDGCTVTNAQNSLGIQSSAEISRNAITSEGDAGISCSLSAWNAEGLQGELISSHNNLQLLGPDGRTIPYQIYIDPGYSNVMTIGKTVQFAPSGIQSRAMSAGSRTVPIYIKTQPGTNLKAGNYHDSVMMSWSFPRCIAWEEGACTAYQTITEKSLVDISLYTDSSCTITPNPDINFGNYSFISQFSPVTQSVTVNCTSGTSYSAWFSNGASYGNSWRKMSSGNKRLLYHVYYYSTQIVWDNNHAYQGRGSGSNQSLKYTATIKTDQPEVPAGSYSDSLSFIVSY